MIARAGFTVALAVWLSIAGAPNPGPSSPAIPINHFIYIIQENRTFDNYFGTFPGANGIPPGTQLPYRPGGPPEVAPFHLHTFTIPQDLSHSRQAAKTAYDNGKMDGFLWAEWPRALQYYWKGVVPQPDPELVHPKPAGAQAAGGRGRQGLAARGGQFGGRMASTPPEGPFQIGCSTLSPIMIITSFQTIGNTPADSRSATISSPL
jgi:hypothetical protein